MGPVFRYLAEDHRRLEGLLQRATAGAGIAAESYWEFRGGLLRHISMEEKILLPAAQKARNGQALAEAARLRLDHGALAALLVLTPTDSVIKAIRAILEKHNAVEEGSDGVYAQCEQLDGFHSEEILRQLKAAPPVAMNPFVDNPIAVTSARNALKRAGYDFVF